MELQKRKRGRPKGFKVSPETLAKMRQVWLDKLSAPGGEELRAQLNAQLVLANKRRDQTRRVPPRGTPERRLFEKLRQALGSAAAHAELARNK